MSDWISARLKVNRPTTKGPVLAFYKTPDEPDGEIGILLADFVQRPVTSAAKVTHWMPLPAPPGKDDEKIAPIDARVEAFFDELSKRLESFRECRRHGADSLLDTRIDELQHVLNVWNGTAREAR